MKEVYELIDYAREQKCSDLHLTAGTAIAFRKNGSLLLTDRRLTIEEAESMIFELLNEEDIEKVKKGEDVDASTTDLNGGRIRVNVYHQRNNVAACIRLLNSNIPSLQELGVPSQLGELARRRTGLLLITGPTGSGKSTTLAALIEMINQREAKHVITIEDPIEYVYKYNKAMVHQREIGKDSPNFSYALRSALREDPDIILVGEMRDYETIKAAVTAAETGHMVLSTLHTLSAAQTVERIISACPMDEQEALLSQLSTVLSGILTQELVPLADDSGRVAAVEFLINNMAVSNLIRERKFNQIPTVIQSNRQTGMQTLNMHLQSLVRSGEVLRIDALKHSNNVQELERMI